jgi:iron complex outermembrane receptor protein
MRTSRRSFLLAGLLLPVIIRAQEAPEEADRIILPPVEITETADSPNVVTREEMDREGALDLWQAVRNVPGVIQSGGGARNDAGFTVRGFDSANVPVFVDGVTQANPYRGDNDAARMLSGDWESITIEKGYSTLLLGPNTMGGAVLIRTARPKAPFETFITTGFDFDTLGKFAANYDILSAGGKGEHFYGKGTVQYRKVDHYRIPYKFQPDKDNPQQKGDRLWSDSSDMKITLLAGWTPLYNMDISLEWIYQDSYKGFSPPSVHGRDYEIWEWPYYKRQSIQLNGKWQPDPWTLTLSGYFQKFDNRLIDYGSWENYQLDMHNPYSDYDDYTAGFHIEAAWDINSWNRAEAALNFRADDHRGLTGEKPAVHVNEDIWSFAAQYTVSPLSFLRISAGLGLDLFVPNEFWGRQNEENLANGYSADYVEKTGGWQLLAAEAGIYYDITQDMELHLSYARKNHFPTMFQRYSTRAGESTPNPYLGPEWADHIELGYKGRFEQLFNLTAAGYFSNISHKIVEIRVPKPDFTAVTVPYSVNLDNTAMWGIEAGIEWSPLQILQTGAAFAWNRYLIINSELGVETLALYPEITASAYAVLSPIKALSIIPQLQYVGARYIDTKGEETMDGYVLVNLKASYDINRHFSASLSVENIFDVLYEIRPYFPQAGRSFRFSFTARY